MRMGVDLVALRAAVAEVQRAADQTASLREHPGQLAGRAADAGDAGLAQAMVEFGSRWDWGWESIGADVERWATLLAAMVETYALVERTVANGPGSLIAQHRMLP